MSDHVTVPVPAEPGRQDHGYAVDPAGRPLALSSTAPAATATAAARPVAPRGPSPRAWRRIGLVVGLVVVANGALQLGPLLGSTHDASLALPATLTSLRIESGSGDIRVRPVAPGESPGATARVRGWGTPGRLELAGTTLRANDLCGSMPVSCDVRLEVAVPVGAALVVDGSSGDVSVTGLSGAVEARLSSGDIDLQGLTGATVTAEATSGDVNLVDVGARRVTAATSSGDVSVSLTVDPDEVRATTTSGDVRVVVPDGTTTYDTSAETSSGDVTNDIGDAPGAEHRIEAGTSSGDVELLRR